jgi:hypothetical protein
MNIMSVCLCPVIFRTVHDQILQPRWNHLRFPCEERPVLSCRPGNAACNDENGIIRGKWFPVTHKMHRIDAPSAATDGIGCAFERLSRENVGKRLRGIT